MGLNLKPFNNPLRSYSNASFFEIYTGELYNFSILELPNKFKNQWVGLSVSLEYLLKLL